MIKTLWFFSDKHKFFQIAQGKIVEALGWEVTLWKG